MAEDDEYNIALDYTADDTDDPPVADDEAVDDQQEPGTQKAALDVPKALGLTEPPKPSAATQVLLEQHPEIFPDYEEAVQERLPIEGSYPPYRGDTNNPRHQTYPYLTLYERTKVLSLRASQLSHGAPPFIERPEHLTDSYEIAQAELAAKKLPYILKRRLPNNTFEYWRLADLMIL